ncbi:MAG: glycosyltransferase family 39 protein [Bdellovibrionales bacterium]|nr:glycosyltransferase family 39 protein [Bdellovibrionales bacterium]
MISHNSDSKFYFGAAGRAIAWIKRVLKGVLQHPGSAAWVFMLLFGIVYGSLLDAREVASRGETREALVVRAMAEQQNLILPLRNGTEIPSKPPLFHWLGYGTAKITGSIDAFSVRFPSLLGALLVLGSTYLFAARHFSPITGVYSILLLASSFEFMRSATHARVDMVFTGFLVPSFYLAFEALEDWYRSGRFRWSILFPGSLALGLAGLAKGPAGIFLPLVAGGVFFVVTERRSLRSSFARLPVLPLLIVVLAAIAILGQWYWFAYLERGSAFLTKQLFQENFARIVESDSFDPGHRKPFLFAIIYPLLAFMPWSLFLPLLINLPKQITDDRRRVPFFLLLWIGVFVLAVLLSESKRVVYFLPILAPLAILLAESICTLTRAPNERRGTLGGLAWIVGGAALLSTVLFGALVLLVLTPEVAGQFALSSARVRPYIDEGIRVLGAQPTFFGFAAFIPVSLWFAFLLWRRLQLQRAVVAIVVALLLGGACALTSILPIDGNVKNLVPFARQIEARVPSVTPLLIYGGLSYPLRYALHRDLVPISTPAEVQSRREAFIVIAEDRVQELTEQLKNITQVARATTAVSKPELRLVLLHYEATPESAE